MKLDVGGAVGVEGISGAGAVGVVALLRLCNEFVKERAREARWVAAGHWERSVFRRTSRRDRRRLINVFA